MGKPGGARPWEIWDVSGGDLCQAPRRRARGGGEGAPGVRGARHRQRAPSGTGGSPCAGGGGRRKINEIAENEERGGRDRGRRRNGKGPDPFCGDPGAGARSGRTCRGAAGAGGRRGRYCVPATCTAPAGGVREIAGLFFFLSLLPLSLPLWMRPWERFRPGTPPPHLPLHPSIHPPRGMSSGGGGRHGMVGGGCCHDIQGSRHDRGSRHDAGSRHAAGTVREAAGQGRSRQAGSPPCLQPGNTSICKPAPLTNRKR